MIRLITNYNEKRLTRPLYEEVFNEDGKGFVDYYYDDRCFDNRILVDEVMSDEGETIIASMIHLNPYRVNLKGRTVEASYVFAVATKKEYRHQGRMRALLNEAFRLCEDEGIAFMFLIPVDTAIYTPFQFEVLCELQSAQGVSYETVRSEYDIYCIRDEHYLRRLRKETELTAMGVTQLLPEHSVIMVRAFDDAVLRALHSGKAFFCEEV